jgi:translocation and assembly module TamA
MARIFLKFIIFIIITIITHGNIVARVEYKASIVGVEKFPEIQNNAKTLSQILNPDSDFNPGSESVLRDILQDDIDRIRSYLESCGFYDAKLFPEIETTAKQLYEITIHIDLGERYTINRTRILVNNKKFPFNKKLLSAQKDTPAINELILNDKQTIATFLKQNGYASVEILDEQVEINHDTLLVNVVYSFKTGPKGVFGSYKINGLTSVNLDYIEKFIQWAPGEPYNIDKINKTESLLLETNLFETVLITPSEPNEKNEFTLNINLAEGKHHHVQLNVYGNVALSKDTPDPYEIGFMPKYAHDNIFNSNEKFEANMILSNIVQDLNLSLRKPHLFFFNTTGRIFLSGEHRSYEAYSYLGLDGGIGIDYKITKYLLADFGFTYEQYSLERQTDLKKNSYSFLGFPLALTLDTRENKIFSNSGIILNTTWTPYINSNYTLHYLTINGSFYLPLIDEYLILAGWGRWGRLSGISFDDSPMDKRIYLGGSQNLRGYSTNSIGRSDALLTNREKSIALGGLSGIAFGIEPRLRVYRKFWSAVFVDVGTISETDNVFKEISGTSDLYWDCGVSFFYFTDFGPLRIDIAYPIGDKISESKKEFKFYISFGQAF